MIDDSDTIYLRSWVAHSETPIGQFESGKQVADLEVSLSRFELAAGRQFGNWGQLEIGASTGSGDSSPRIGDLSRPTQEFNTGAWFVNFGYDRLDSINFPRSGSLANVTWSASREALGADVELDALIVNALWAGTWNKHTLMFWSGIAGVVDTEAPAERAFSIGGLFNLSGYLRSE